MSRRNIKRNDKYLLKQTNGSDFVIIVVISLSCSINITFNVLHPITLKATAMEQ